MKAWVGVLSAGLLLGAAVAQGQSVVKDYTEVTVAQFSGPIPDGGVSGPLGVGSTGFGCTVQGKLAPLGGHIAILDRGGPQADAGCSFVEKARNAQDAGAIALLLANNTTGIITPSGTAPDVVIPVLMMTQVDGQALKNAVQAGPASALIIRDASQGYQGADSSRRAFMYAPSTLESGSSVSHWDTSAFPNLLMEPIISPDLTHSLDLTVPALRDIDWFADAGIGNAGTKATVVIVNADAPDAGFNDPTPVTPVGGNAGRTLGAQRLAVFQEAARIWGDNLNSAVPITVLSHFQPLTCDSTGATLGSAGPTNIFASDDPTLDGGVPPSAFPRQHTWYVSAEAQRFAGKPLLSGTGTDPANYDIVARFNSTLDDPNATNCHGFAWYYGLDNQHGAKLDLLTVVLHELGHGLGFISLTDPATGTLEQNEPDIWSYVLYDKSTGLHWVDMDDNGRKASAISGALAWDGPAVKDAVPTTLGFPPLVRVTSATSSDAGTGGGGGGKSGCSTSSGPPSPWLALLGLLVLLRRRRSA